MKLMEPDLLVRFINETKRSKAQTNYLFDLCDGDFQKLVKLEEKIKNNFIGYCPSSKKEIEKILNMDDESGWFNLEHFRSI